LMMIIIIIKVDENAFTYVDFHKKTELESTMIDHI